MIQVEYKLTHKQKVFLTYLIILNDTLKNVIDTIDNLPITKIQNILKDKKYTAEDVSELRELRLKMKDVFIFDERLRLLWIEYQKTTNIMNSDNNTAANIFLSVKLKELVPTPQI